MSSPRCRSGGAVTLSVATGTVKATPSSTRTSCRCFSPSRSRSSETGPRRRGGCSRTGRITVGFLRLSGSVSRRRWTGTTRSRTTAFCVSWSSRSTEPTKCWPSTTRFPGRRRRRGSWRGRRQTTWRRWCRTGGTRSTGCRGRTWRGPARSIGTRWPRPLTPTSIRPAPRRMRATSSRCGTGRRPATA